MRKRHCLMVRPRRCIWAGDRETGTEGSQRTRHCLMVTRIVVSDVGPYGRKD